MNENTKVAYDEICAIKSKFKDGDYSFANKKLLDIICGFTGSVQSIAILTASFPAKSKLSNYDLALKTTKVMLSRDNLDGEKILKGL